jgi:hypothetical protein
MKKKTIKQVIVAILIAIATQLTNEVITRVLDTPKSEQREDGRPQKQVSPQPPAGTDK